MNVGDSAEEFISIHSLGHERLLLSSVQSALKKYYFCPLGDDSELFSQFSTHQSPTVFLTVT